MDAATPRSFALFERSKSLSFDKFPIELRMKITQYLSQFDCLNLMVVNRSCYMSSLPRLYSSIVIDSKFNFCDTNEIYQSGRTYINSAYNLKRFIKSVHSSQKNDPFIVELVCINLPDSFDIYDYTWNTELILFFQKLRHLKKLIWINDNFRLQFLSNLPNKEALTDLVLNIKFSNYLNDCDEVSQWDHLYGNLYFPNITNFQIMPFHDSLRIRKIINNLLINNNDEEVVSQRLKCLVLKKQCEGDYNYIEHDSSSSICNIFTKSKLQYLSNLSRLSLIDINVSSNDGYILKNSINMKKLRSLSLTGLIEDNVDESSFLLPFALDLINLRCLSLDIRQTYDHIPDFLVTIPHLDALDITIHLYEDWAEMTKKYVYVLGNFTKLSKLSLDFTQESTSPFVRLGIPESFCDGVSKLINLRSLRIWCGSNHDHLPDLVAQLPKLTYLDVPRIAKSLPPFLQYNRMIPGVYFDDMSELRRHALYLFKSNESIKYVRINSSIFECNDVNVISRDGISRWFEERVRYVSELGV
ncbi:hypothetical protein JA1_002484 [Spathaspora sp. JA1]|nr:hypothetical protein JA1_002484 [Spathaspora sp. JA1]